MLRSQIVLLSVVALLLAGGGEAYEGDGGGAGSVAVVRRAAGPDSDGDGVPDDVDGCPYDAHKIEPGACGCGVPDLDSDSDGYPDCVDGCPHNPYKNVPGVCGCGGSDFDTDGDGVADCDDGCPRDPEKVVPGWCGCGNSERDADLDGVPDCVDEGMVDVPEPGMAGGDAGAGAEVSVEGAAEQAARAVWPEASSVFTARSDDGESGDGRPEVAPGLLCPLVALALICVGLAAWLCGGARRH